MMSQISKSFWFSSIVSTKLSFNQLVLRKMWYFMWRLPLRECPELEGDIRKAVYWRLWLVCPNAQWVPTLEYTPLCRRDKNSQSPKGPWLYCRPNYFKTSIWNISHEANDTDPPILTGCFIWPAWHLLEFFWIDYQSWKCGKYPTTCQVSRLSEKMKSLLLLAQNEKPSIQSEI